MIRITDQQGLALRKHALPTLRKLGVKDGADYQPHKVDWNTLQDHGKDVLKACPAPLWTESRPTPPRKNPARLKMPMTA
jgi:hypothetical protein